MARSTLCPLSGHNVTTSPPYGAPACHSGRVDLLPGVTSHVTETDRLRMHWLQSGPEDGVPVVLVHGNLSTGRFFEHLLPGAPDRFRFLAPDMRGFGRSDPLALDATRGLRDWSDDVRSLLTALGVEAPVHLLGWSTGGAAISHYAMEHGGVASLTYVDTVSPYGFGGVHEDGTPCFPDYAGSGGGTGSPDFVARLQRRRHRRRLAALAAQRAELVLLGAGPPRAARARGPARRRDPPVPHRRRGIPGRRDAVARTGPASRPGRRGSSTRCRRSTATGRGSSTSTRSRRCCGRTARRTSSSPTARRGSWVRWARRARSPAGPGRRCSRRSRW